MSEKEKSIIRRLSETVQTLDREKQQYLIGVAEGMALARDDQQGKQSQKV